MKEIPLTQGKVALVDDCDYEELSKFKWYAVKDRSTYYVRRSKRFIGHSHATAISMHRQILGLQNGDGTVVDHINHDGLDNRRDNLRACTNQQNTLNKSGVRLGAKSSKFKGVYWEKRRLKWHSRIMVKNKYTHLGYFASEEDAARAYDAAAIKYHGEFASLNFPTV